MGIFTQFSFFIKKIKVVADSPSARAMSLKESSKIKPRAKIIFGTGDNLQAITMTSNIGFVRAAIQQVFIYMLLACYFSFLFGFKSRNKIFA